MRDVVAWYAIAVGVLMVGWWTMDLRSGALQRPDRTRAEMLFHLAAEFLTAAALVVGGIVLVLEGSVALALVGLGMLLYTVIQSPGYFVARGEPPLAIMFGVLQAVTLVAIISLVALA